MTRLMGRIFLEHLKPGSDGRYIAFRKLPTPDTSLPPSDATCDDALECVAGQPLASNWLVREVAARPDLGLHNRKLVIFSDMPAAVAIPDRQA